MRVGIVGRQSDRLEACKQSILDSTPTAQVTCYACDATDPRAVGEAFAELERKQGKADALVYNVAARPFPPTPLGELTPDRLESDWKTGPYGALLCTQAVLPMMRTRKWGRIVNISSGAARGAGAIGPHYNASKAAVEGLTRGYAARLVKEGITVNAVAPSLIETDMMKGQSSLVSRIPVGRFGTVEEVAQAVVLLVNNPYMTGQTIAMSGGMAFN